MSFPAHPADASIPTAHTPLSCEQLEQFADWMDEQLLSLESAYADFVTQQSRKLSASSLRDSREAK